MAKKTTILGWQIADAKRAEAERTARGDSGPSPLQPDDRYDEWNGELELYDPVRLPLDDRISTLCRTYASSDTVARAATRRALSLDDSYTLLTFGRRSAVFALRTRESRLLVDSLTAVAMIEIDRIDFRDADGPLFLAYAIFHLLGIDSSAAFSEAAALAEPRIAELLKAFLSRPAHHKELRAACYQRVDSPGGPGVIRRSISPYAPTVQLDKLILQVAELLRGDKYSPSVEIGTELPEIWLSKIDDSALSAALRTVVAGATANAELRPEASADYQHQRLFAIVVETADESVATTLFRISEKKRRRKNDVTMLALQCGKLFCLCVARSIVVNGRPFESAESIMRFLPGLKEILGTHSSDDAVLQATVVRNGWRGLVDRLFNR